MTYVTTDAAVTVNDAAARIVAAYLDYAARVVTASLSRQGYSGDRFREIDDDLVVKPRELVDLVNRVQAALARIDD